jgi:hypothetical protein
MDLAKVLQQLHEELENLNAAISSLERLQEAGKNRGKEPWLGDLTPPAPTGTGRKRKSKVRSKDVTPDNEPSGEGADPNE